MFIFGCIVGAVVAYGSVYGYAKVFKKAQAAIDDIGHLGDHTNPPK